MCRRDVDPRKREIKRWQVHLREAGALGRRVGSHPVVRDREAVRAERVQAEDHHPAPEEPLHQIFLVGRGREERDEQGHDVALGLGAAAAAQLVDEDVHHAAPV